MSERWMHADEVETSPSLVRRLIAAQFPRWASLPIARVQSDGTDNALYRLGEQMVMRLPRTPGAAGRVDKEHEWLPRLGPLLPLDIPTPVARGEAAEGYPWRWSVYEWLDGENATIEGLADPNQAATTLAGFITALHRIELPGGPPPGEHNFGRGVPLAMRDARTRDAIDALHGSVDTRAATAAWEAALHAALWDAAPVWIHGDMSSGNLLTNEGRLTAVIDFGGLGVGDPACDLMIAWEIFSGESRDVFRTALDVDDATWARGRGWALSQALIFIPYYIDTNPSGVEKARHMLDEVFADHDAAL